MNIYKFSLFTLAILGLILAPAGSIYAQPEAIKSARREVVEAADKLAEVREQNLNPREKEQKEFELKKLTLEKIFNLTELETQDLKTKLQNLDEVEAELLILKDGFLVSLTNFLEFLADTKGLLAKSGVLTSVQNLAGQFKNWREAVYNPEIKKIVEFVITFQNKGILKTADLRFEKIAAEIRKLRPAPKSIPEYWLALLNQSALGLKAARDLNSQAVNQLLNYLPKEEIVGEDEGLENEEVKEESQTTEPEIEATEPTIKELAEMSLGKIREAYRNFILLSDLIKKAK